ncbi:methyltransferase [Rubellicoccus peritrichatus]|uniref:Methyltransferase n=1 Tax=Rubellicoccus peritrichatus TaxID=3080537 RepID=A0AAQ3L7X5_9BACT|nr:methyltransferase [Puniceicoccus sp. CR14]WOO39534.1 methyltransferase [Puniceicoccus sp. CR14]
MSHQPPSHPFPPVDDNLLWDLNCSFIHFPTVIVADELGLFAILDEEARTRDAIADKLQLGSRATEAMLGVLTSLKFLTCEGERYYLTPVSKNYLLPSSEYYWGDVFAMNRQLLLGAEPLKRAMLENQTSPYLGKDSDESLIDEWDSGEVDEDTARGFTKCMHALFWGHAQALAAMIDIGPVTRLLDVGGGSGCFSIALSRKNPDLKCTIMDLKPVCLVTQEFIKKLNAADQVDAQAGNMFSPDWPSGYDGVFFSNIFHDWWEERCRLVARNSFEALPSGGRIFLFEMLLDDTRNGPLTCAGFSMFMVYYMRGKQYSACELRSFLEDAGFVDFEVRTIFGYFSLVSARKP